MWEKFERKENNYPTFFHIPYPDSDAVGFLSLCAVKSPLLQLCCVLSSSYGKNPGLPALARRVHLKLTLVLRI